jgi:hypothetical protein
MPGYNSQRLGTANTLPSLLFVLFCLLFVLFFVCYSCCFVVNLMFYVLFMCKCVLAPGVNPIAVDKYIISISISISITVSKLLCLAVVDFFYYCVFDFRNTKVLTPTLKTMDFYFFFQNGT